MLNDDVQFESWQVTLPLRPYVNRIVGFRDVGPPVIRRELPQVGCPMLFVFGAPFRLSDREQPAVLSSTHGSFTAGVFDTFTMSQSTGPTSGIQVDLSPLGAYIIGGTPMQELSNRIVNMEDLSGREVRDLAERLGSLERWDERFQLIETFFLDRVRQHSGVTPEVLWAWKQMVAANGNVSVALITDELQWSRKRLRAAFLREVGFPPKTMGRLLRYRYVMDLATGYPHVGWSEIASRAGYSDQSHLHRDLLAFTGTTPVALRSELAEGTFVQDGQIIDS